MHVQRQCEDRFIIFANTPKEASFVEDYLRNLATLTKIYFPAGDLGSTEQGDVPLDSAPTPEEQVSFIARCRESDTPCGGPSLLLSGR